MGNKGRNRKGENLMIITGLVKFDEFADLVCFLSDKIYKMWDYYTLLLILLTKLNNNKNKKTIYTFTIL